jgi:hypothetical protein
MSVGALVFDFTGLTKRRFRHHPTCDSQQHLERLRLSHCRPPVRSNTSMVSEDQMNKHGLCVHKSGGLRTRDYVPRYLLGMTALPAPLHPSLLIRQEHFP